MSPQELVSPPQLGRVFERRMRPGITDVDSSGRARLDAVARWLQDVAYLDVLDAGFEGRAAWIVRRGRIRAERMPGFGEELSLRTFCSGIGRFCAERRTTIQGPSALVEAVATWVHLDPVRGTPMRFDDDFREIYSVSAGDRGASARLTHPGPPESAERVPWEFRVTELDLAGHVNNSYYWEALEAQLASGEGGGPSDGAGGGGGVPDGGGGAGGDGLPDDGRVPRGNEPGRSEPVPDAEIEHADAAAAGPVVLHRAEGGLWFSDTTDGRLLASIRFGSAPRFRN